MGAERELFIDIDRQPERERPRPSDVPADRPGNADPLWPALAEGDASQQSPASARHADNLGILPTMPLASDLVESLAVLLPKS